MNNVAKKITMHKLYMESDDILNKYSAIYNGYTLDLKKQSLDNLIKGLTQVRDLISNEEVNLPDRVDDRLEQYQKKCHDFAEKHKEKHYLTKEEIDRFFEDGLVYPFKVMDRDDAVAFRCKMEDKVARGKLTYGPFEELESDEWYQKCKELNMRTDIEMRGWNRHFNIPELMDVLSSEPCVKRLASLLGEDVYLWRSQFFPLKLGAAQTSLHQVDDFRYSLGKPPLIARTTELPRIFYNLTLWIALTDVDENSGALVLIKGSHKNIWMTSGLEEKNKFFNNLSIKEIVSGQLINAVGGAAETRFDNAGFAMNILKKIYPNRMDRLEKNMITPRMKAGEAVIFTSCTIHGSHTNQGNEKRLALGGRYAGGSVDIYPDDEYVEDGHFNPVVVSLNKAYLQGLKVH
ncbi:MAG: hypothetical protein F6J86_05670 [Symploca sp. SIO1B1]|nr:hypothetical protein [Symploca sp. SIO1C2]NER93310.1 hypothetical protein [Symploca sp. SIO1B1]